MNFRAGDEWKPIDSDLEQAADGAVTTKATGYDVSLPKDLSAAVEVSKDDAGVAFTLRDAAGDRTVNGNVATFADALPGVDVDYTAGADVVKEELVLEGADAQRAFAFDIDPTSGLTPSIGDDGGIDLRDAAGEVKTQIAPPVMSDADGNTSTDLRYRLDETASGWTLRLDADTPWLRDASRAWPVKVDPTVYFGGNFDTFIADPKGGADNAVGQLSYIQASSEGDRRRRGLLRFNLSGIPKSAVVTNGNINLNTYAGGDSNLDVSIHKLTSPFTTGATWGKRDGTTNWSTAGGDFQAQAEDTQTIDASTAGSHRFYAGNMIQDWVSGEANNGLLIKVVNEATPGNTRSASFHSTFGGTDYPYMEVTWDEPTGAKPNWTFDTIGLSDRSKLKVNVASGDVGLDATDVSIPGVAGMGLDVTRSYASRGFGGGAGQGWFLGHGMETYSSNYNNGQTVVIRTPDHAAWRFRRTGSTWTSPAAINATLTDVTGGRKLLFHRSGETWFFDDAKGSNLGYREDKNGHRITYAYNGSGQLTSITDTHGRSYTIGRNSAGLPTTITDAGYPGSARVWTYAYVNNGGITTLASYTDPAGKTTTYGYDSGTSDLTQITDARGNKTKLTYSYAIDPSGLYPRVTSIQRMTNSDFANPVGPKWTYSYDLAAKTTTVTVPNGNTSGATASQHQTTYYWDEASLQVKYVKNRLGQFDQTARSDNGDVTKFTGQGTGPAGGTGTGTAAISDLTYSADGNNNPTKSEGPLNGGKRETSTTSFYGASSMFGGAAASPATGQYRPQMSTDAQGSQTAFEYDAAGNLTKASASGLAVKADLAYYTAADGATLRGLLKTATDGKGNVTSYGYSAAGDLTSVKPPLVGSVNPGELAYTYEAGTNRRKTQVDKAANTLTYGYDKLDRVTSIANSNGQTITYGYDNNGNLTSRTWTPSAAGPNATYVYDTLNRRTSETIGGVTTTYAYDDDGNLKTFVDAGGTTTYGYDRLDRVESIAPPAGGTVTAAYNDTASPRTRTWTYPGGAKQRTDYALSGKVLGVSATSSTNTAIAGLTYTYGPGPSSGTEASLRQTEIQSAPTAKTTTYAYDSVNRLCWATTKTVANPACGTVPSGAGGITYSYGWDLASNRTLTRVDNAGTITRNDTYTYDAANELTGSYSHDTRGNLLTGGNTYDAFNRQSAATSTSLSHATPDNTELVTDGTTTLRNTLLGLTTSVTGASNIYYVRTPDGELIGERTSAGTRYAVLDALGSTRWLLSGNTISRGYDYTPDGDAAATGTGADTRIRFAGGDRTSSGLYHYGARYYNPAAGRWTQRDPLGQPADLAQANPYAYAGANPVNATDQSGRVCDVPGCGGYNYCNYGDCNGVPSPKKVRFHVPSKKDIVCTVVSGGAGLAAAAISDGLLTPAAVGAASGLACASTGAG